jgi:hypothetical protein
MTTTGGWEQIREQSKLTLLEVQSIICTLCSTQCVQENTLPNPANSAKLSVAGLQLQLLQSALADFGQAVPR